MNFQLIIFSDLTEKGLKKLGHSIDVSYKTILKLVVRHLNKAALHICYHLTALKGMAKNVFDYEVIYYQIFN